MLLDPADVARLRDMIDYAQEAIDLLGGPALSDFIADRRTFLAVSHCIGIVGEAGWKLSDPVKRAHSTIPWPLIAGMRHKLVHDYGRTEHSIVHRVVAEHLPPLVRDLRIIIAAEVPPPG